MSRGKPLSFDPNEALLKALDLFWKKGFAKTGMTELLEYMGIQRQSFYNTFGNKEEVFIEALKLYTRSHMDKMNAMMEQDRHPLENIKELFDLMGRASDKKENAAVFVNSMTEFGDSQDAVGELLKEVVYGSYEVYLQAFTRAIENGYIPETKKPQGYYHSVFSYVVWNNTAQKGRFR